MLPKRDFLLDKGRGLVQNCNVSNGYIVSAGNYLADNFPLHLKIAVFIKRFLVSKPCALLFEPKNSTRIKSL